MSQNQTDTKKEQNMENNRELMSRGLPSEHEMMVYKTMAKGAVTSGLYKGKEESIIMIMLAARELGIPPMQALNGGIYIIMGNVVISARMMNALIRKSGHSLMVEESTATYCKIRGARCDTGETFTSDFSIDDAKKAQLVKTNSGWEKYPKDMLFARALSRVARQLFADVIGMGYVEGEIIEDNKMPDNDKPPELPHIPQIEKSVSFITDEMEGELKELLLLDNEFKEKVDDFLGSKNLTSLSELSFEDFNKILKRAKSRKEAKNDTAKTGQ